MGKGKPIGLIGGSFDPVHIGHVRMALGCIETLDLQAVCFVPANVSPLKSASGAGRKHRVEMLKRALGNQPQLAIDELELNRGGVSYTVDTLRELRRGEPHQPLCFIMGADAFDTLPAWRRWRELTDYAHLVVVGTKAWRARDGDARLHAYYAERACSSPAALHTCPGGFIHKTDVNVPAISSTRIRALLNNHEDAGNELPPGVYDYIKENKLYE